MSRRRGLHRPVPGWRWRGERGSESVELAILMPVAILVLAMLVIGARIALAGSSMSGVAGIAARDASLARSGEAAELVATASATRALADRELHCADVGVTVDTSGFHAVPGDAVSVTVEVTCTVDLSDIGAPGLPGARTLRDSATSPLDPARDLL
jgi:hypothetical protein